MSPARFRCAISMPMEAKKDDTSIRISRTAIDGPGQAPRLATAPCEKAGLMIYTQDGQTHDMDRLTDTQLRHTAELQAA